MNRFVFNEPSKNFSAKSQLDKNKNTVTPL